MRNTKFSMITYAMTFAGAVCALALQGANVDSVESKMGTLAVAGSAYTASALEYNAAPSSDSAPYRTQEGWYAGIQLNWDSNAQRAADTSGKVEDEGGLNEVNIDKIYKSLSNQTPSGCGMSNVLNLKSFVMYMKTTEWYIYVTPEFMYSLNGSDYTATLTIGGNTYAITVPNDIVLGDGSHQWYPAVGLLGDKVYGEAQYLSDQISVENYGTVKFLSEPVGVTFGDGFAVSDNGDGTWGVTMTHSHAWEVAVSADGATLTATCGNAGCPVEGATTVSLALSSGDKAYDGTAITASADFDSHFKAIFPDATTTISTEKDGEAAETIKDVGEYTVKMTVTGLGDGQSHELSRTVTVAKADISEAELAFTPATLTYNCAEQTVVPSVTVGEVTATLENNGLEVTEGTCTAMAMGVYPVTVNGTGNFTGTATATWSIVNTTGEPASVAASADGSMTNDGNDFTLSDSTKLEYDAEQEKWYAGITITWPMEKKDWQLLDWDCYAHYVSEGSMRVAMDYGETSNVTHTGSYKSGVTSSKNFTCVSNTTWKVAITPELIEAAIADEKTELVYTMNAGAIVWGNSTEGDLDGVAFSDYTITIPLEGIALCDNIGNQVYPQHTHDWRYSRSDDGTTITARCETAGCFLSQDDFLSMSIASKDATDPDCAEGHYRDGNPAEAFLDGVEEFAHTGAVIGAVKYEAEGGEELEEAPVEPGMYSAFVVVTADGSQGEAGSWTLRIDGLEILAGEAMVDGVHVKDAAAYLERATGDSMEISAVKSYAAERAYVIPKKYGTLSLLNCGKKTYDLAGFAVTAAVGSPLFENNGSLVIRDTSESATGTISANEGSVDDVVIVNSGTLVIEGGTFVGSIANDGGTVTLKGGRFSVKPDESFVADGFELIRRGEYWCVEKHEHKYVVSSVADRFLVATCMNVIADGTLQVSHCTGRMLIGVVGIRKLGLIPQLSVDYDRKGHSAEFYAINMTGVVDLLKTDGLLDAVKAIIESDPANLDAEGLLGLLTTLSQNADFADLIGKVGNVFVSQSKFEDMTGATIGEISYFMDGEAIEGNPVEPGLYTAALEVETAGGDRLALMGTYRINEKELPIETEGHSKHAWSFEADGAKVTATCPGNMLMGIECNASPMGLELVPSVEGGRKVFDAIPLEVTVSNLNTFVINTDADVSGVVYVAADGTESSSLPVEPGEYTAKVEVASGRLIDALVKYTATLDLTIEEKEPEGRFPVDGWTRHVGAGADALTAIDGKFYYSVELSWPHSLEQILQAPRFTDPDHARIEISTAEGTFTGTGLLEGAGEGMGLGAEASEFFRIRKFANQTYMKGVTWLIPFTPEEIDEALDAGKTEIVRTITLEGKCWEDDLDGLAPTTYTIVLDVEDLVVNDPEGRQVYPVHNHVWTAEAGASSLTLVCDAEGCPQAPGLVAELSFGSTNKTYDAKVSKASLTGADAMLVHASVEFGEISYVEIGEGEEEHPLADDAPCSPGRYRAMVEYSDGGDIAGALSAEFEILPIDVSELFACFSDTRMEFVYSGEEVGPGLLSVWYGIFPLKQGTDYAIEGDFRCVETGDYSFSIVGIGNYAGTLEFSWKIVEPYRPFASNALKVADGTSDAPSWGEISEDGMSAVVVNATNLVYDATGKKWIAPLVVDWPANVDVLLLSSAQYTDPAHAEVSADCGETCLETAFFRPALSLNSAEYVTRVHWEPCFTMEEVVAAFDAGDEELVFELTVGSTAWTHDPFGLKETTYRLVVPIKELFDADSAVARFEVGEYVGVESNVVDVVVCGGSLFRPCFVRVDLAYRSAAAADLDLAKGMVDGVTPNGGLKFPMTLAWDTGDTAAKTISIPLKADRLVEDDEFFLLQLSEPVGIGIGDPSVSTVTVMDRNGKEPKSSITPYRPRKEETVAMNEVVVTAAPQEGGFAAGSGTYTAGTKLTMVAEARPGWTFAGWRDLDSGDIVSVKPRYQIVVSGKAGFCAEFSHQAYIRGLADPADGGKVTGSGYCPEGRKVTLWALPVNSHFRFLRWENEAGEAVASTRYLVIDRTAKPAKSSNSTTVLTDVTYDATFYAVFSGDPRVTATPVALTGEDGVVLSEGGRVTGAGHYAPGRKVSLRATANKGFAFSGWYDASGGGLISQSASLTFDMAAEDVDLYARFVTVEEDKASISLAMDGVEMSVEPEDVPVYTNYCGVAVGWPIEASALSAPTVRASGLPSGVKLVQDKVTGAWSLAGAPTAASRTDKAGVVTPSKVKLTVTTAGRSTQVYAFDWTVLPLPEWAAGSFDGEVEDFGAVAMTVAANGRISGKVSADGLVLTLAAGSFDSESDGVFSATVIGKSGRYAVTNVVEVSSVDVGGTEVGVASGDMLAEQPAAWVAYQNLWKRTDAKASMPVFRKSIAKTLELGEPGDAGNTLKLTFRANGAVSFAGKVDGVAVSGTSQLVMTEDGWSVTLYAPPKGSFPGRCGTVPVALTFDGQNVVTDVELELK